MSSVTIVLVEDDIVDVKTIQRAFQKNKISNPLYITSNGVEALEFLRHQGNYSNAAEAPRPNLILLDLNMPVMNGLEFLEAMKADRELKQIPVVIMTTSKEDSDRLESYNLGVAGYIVKPVEFDKFQEMVKIIDLYWSLNEKP